MPLESSVSTKALVFQYTVVETADTVVSVCVGLGLSPLDSASPLTSTQVPQVLRIRPVLLREQYPDIGHQWPQTQTVIVIASHKQEYKLHAQAVGVMPLPPYEEHLNGM